MVHPWGGNIQFILEPGYSPSTDFELVTHGAYFYPFREDVNFSLEDGYGSPDLEETDFLLLVPDYCPPYEPPGLEDIEVVLEPGYVLPGAWSIEVVLDPCPDDEPPVEPIPVALYLSLKILWGQSTPKSYNPIQFPYGSVPRVDKEIPLPYNLPPVVEASVLSPWGDVPKKDVSKDSSWNAGIPVDTYLDSTWNKLRHLDPEKEVPWNAATILPPFKNSINWERVYPADLFLDSSWNRASLPLILVTPPPYTVGSESTQVTLPIGNKIRFDLQPVSTGSWDDISLKEIVIYRPALRYNINFFLKTEVITDTDFFLTGFPAYQVPTLDEIFVVLDPYEDDPPQSYVEVVLGKGESSGVIVIHPDPYVQQRTDPSPDLSSWNFTPTKDTSLVIPWGPGGRWPGRDPIIGTPWVNDPQPPPIPPPVSPAQPVYIVMNEISVVRLPGLEVIHVSAVNVSGSVDSLYWSFTADLSNPNQLPLLQKDEDGPKEIQVTINGHVWVFLVEDYDEGKEFVNQTVSLNGRSRTALMSDPFAPRRSFVSEAPFTIQQLMERELEDTGFTLDYDTVDWVVPAGAFYYQDLTPMEVIVRLAEASGAVVQSHPVNKVIQVRARYPESPWNWDAVDLDKAINDDQIRTTSLQNKSLPLYDFVLVSGESAGVSDIIQRTGSGGEIRMPMVVDSLILTHPAAQERGRNLLSNHGEQAVIAITILLNPAATQPGRILPLELVEVQESPVWIGLALSTNITVSVENDRTLDVWMTNSFERHYND